MNVVLADAEAVLAQIGARFPGVVSDDQLDRAALSGQVFGDPAALAPRRVISAIAIMERWRSPPDSSNG